MALEARAVRRALQRKFGFELREGGKHEIYILELKGQGTVVTQMSRGHREISDTILRRMAEQLRAGNLRTLLEMVECTIDREQYYALLNRYFEQ